MRRIAIGALWLGSIAAAVWLSSSGEHRVVEAPAAAPVVRQLPAASIHDIRAVVRDEVRSAPTVEPSAPAIEPDDPDYEQARQELAAALADGRWTEADRSSPSSIPSSTRVGSRTRSPARRSERATAVRRA